MTADQPEVVLDGALAKISVGSEPGLVSGCSPGEAPNVGVGLAGISRGAINGILEEHPIDPSAARVGNPLVVDAGNGEATGELDLGDILNCGEEVLGCAININVSGQVRWLNGVGSSPRPSEVVRSRDWW